MQKAVTILGSSNSDGERRKTVSFVADKTNYSIIALQTKKYQSSTMNSKIGMMIFIR